MKTILAATLAAGLMTAAAAPAFAQTYTQRSQEYTAARQEYERRMREYEDNRTRYERDRAEYDRRYGAGTFERYYGPFRERPPVYDDRNYDDRYYDDRYSTDRSYDDRYDNRDRYDPYYDDRYDNRYAYDSYGRFTDPECERRYATRTDRTGGTVLGALIGGAIGAVAAGDSSETEGAILGAIVGGALGNNIAGNSSTASRYAPRCDASGYYYTYDQTIPYRENTRYRNGRYDYNYYVRQRCRLAIAPDDRYGRVDYRYVRVCPDRSNRYRITS